MLPVVERAARPAARADLDRHLQGRGRAARRWRAGAAIVNDVSGLRVRAGAGGAWSRERGAALVLMHTRGRSEDDVRARRRTTTSCARSSTSCATSIARRDRRRRRRRADHRRPGHRVCQTAGAQLWCAGAAARVRGGARIGRCSSGRRASRSCGGAPATARRRARLGRRRPR